MRRLLPALGVGLALGCGGAGAGQASGGSVPVERPAASFGDDLAFLRQHVPDLVVLARGRARVAVAPDYQGRVMTSSARGDAGASCGWIHRAHVASGARAPHMNAFGGEDRFWLGPEGGQFGLYFPPGAPFDLEHWQVPEPIDWGPWPIVEQGPEAISFRRDMALVNASGASFAIRVDRRIELLPDAEIAELTGGRAGVDAVAYRSVNTITNAGAEAWRADTGLLSIWILSMYPPSPSTTVVLPFRGEGEPVVNDAYFGPVPSDRLRVDPTAHVVYFRADGLQRSKIGLPPERALPVLGSWDAERGLLTIVRYTPGPEGARYVNSMWEQQRDPYAGDVVNSYNDGPPGPGLSPLGPFYELESSSPALPLAPGEQLAHTHTTYHLEGPRPALDAIARDALGVGLEAIERGLGVPGTDG